MSTQPEFPSDEWFSVLVDRATADPGTMESLGVADLRLGIEVTGADRPPALFGLVFDGYDLWSVGAVDEGEFGPEVVLSGTCSTWEEMVASIESHGRADGPHTLNSLSLAGVPLTVRAADAVGHDKFFRYMGTLQAVFDALGTSAVEPVGSPTP